MVDRNSRPASLTVACEQISEVALSSIQRLEDECAALRQTNHLDKNFAVKFAAQHSIAWRFFPLWLWDFEAHFGPIVSRVRADDLPMKIRLLGRCACGRGTALAFLSYQKA